MDKVKHQSRNPRRSTKTPTMSASVVPAAGNVPASKTDNGSCRMSSASGSMMADSSPSRSSTPDAAGALASSTAANKYRHTREELLKLRYSPLSKLKPELCSFINKLFDGNCREADASTADEGASVRQAMAIRKHLNLGGEPQSYPSQVNARDSGDQNIVLVPRRQSFSTGCHIASTGSVNSPDLKRGSRRDGHRVGSGRIQISEKYLDRDLRDPRPACNRDPDQDDRHYDRIGAGSRGVKVVKRDYERRRQEGGKGGRGVGGSRSSKGDPEWFTDGPVSQSDTIELRGFDQGNSSRRNLADAGGSDIGYNASKVEPASDQNKEVDCVEPIARKRGRNKVSNVRLGAVDENGEKDDCRPPEKNSPSNSVSSSNQQMHEDGIEQTSGGQWLRNSSSPVAPGRLHAANADLDFNAIFNIDSIPGLSEMFALDPEQPKPGSSRFKQWFPFAGHGDSHCEESCHSSHATELGFINDIICGHSGPPGTLSPPLAQPVHGAAASSTEICSSETQNLLDLLQKAHGDAIGIDFRSMGMRNDGSIPNTPVHPIVNSGDSGTSFNQLQQNLVDSKVDPKTVEAGLKAILSGSAPSGPLFSALPSMVHLGSLAAGPPSGAKVLMAEDLEAQLVTGASDRSDSSRAASASSPSHQSNCRSSAGGSFAPSLLTSLCNGNNAGNLSFFSLPVLPVGTKVTMLSELEASLKGLGVAGASGQHPDGGAALPANAFANRMADLAAYKKLLGLVMDPCGGPTAVEVAQPIVTSPTSASMNSLEANQPNNSLASNQRDFIQRYLLQQQQLKMLDCSQPPPSEGIVLAPPGVPPHNLPPDVHHPLYLASFSDHTPSGQTIAPSSQGAGVHPLLEPSICGYPGVGPLRAEEDLSLLPPEFRGGQLHRSPADGGGGLPADDRNFFQYLETVGGKQMPRYMVHQSPVNHAVPPHSAGILNQQQAAMMMHLAAQDKFKGPVKCGPDAPAARPQMSMPGMPVRPPGAHHPAGIAALPSPGVPILAPPQTLLQQQHSQSPRRAHSPLVFGSQPPLNLTAPLPVHLGRMTPVLSPTQSSPNTLQVTQPGSNPNSPAMRVPSPQELSSLAQSILQNALIKKQLEEQRERFVKRQQERNKSLNVPTSPMPPALSIQSNSGQPLVVSESSTILNSGVLEAGKGIPSSFLPTSVLRKTIKTKMEEKLAGRLGDAEKNVPLLKVVKPDEEDADGADDERRNSLNEQTDPGRQASMAEEAELRPSAARRLLGQGLMNLNPSSSSSDAQTHQMFGEPGAVPPAIAGFVPSGRQIRGKNHLPINWPPGSGIVRGKAGHQPGALQQQLNQAQFLASGGNGPHGNSPHGNAGMSMNALHALEMAKILEQHSMGLASPAPPPPAQFVPSPPTENGAFGAKQLPRMMAPPPFGMNPSASNGLLLQMLGLSDLQRAALSPANPPNINQLALMRAFQQQQQQQHMWNRNPMHPPTSNRPAFLPSSQSSANLNASLLLSSMNGIDKQNGSVVSCANTPFDSTGGRQDAFSADIDRAGHRQITEAMLSAPGVSSGSLGYDMLVGSAHLTGPSVGSGSRQLLLSQNERMPDGGLARWFGSDVLQQNMPPPLAHVGQKILTVDEIECWQQVNRS